MISQSEYEEFRDNINTIIEEYRNKFSLPVITDSRRYEKTYRKRLLGMSRDLRSMIKHASAIEIHDFARPSLIDAREKAVIIIIVNAK